MLRHQLAAYSPLTLRAGLGAAAEVLGARADPREALAQWLRKEFAADSVQLYGSGTQALQRAIETAARHTGGSSPVALPAFTCYSVASAAVGAGAKIALYDVDPSTLSPELSSLERLLAAGARAVVVNCLYGVPVDWQPISALAQRYGAVLIEDAAQGHGACWDGRPLGSLGSISVLSFGRGKGWTGGGGGALLLRSCVVPENIEAAELPLSREVGTLTAIAAQWVLGRPTLYGIPRSIPGLGLGETVYHDPRTLEPMPRSAAALLLRGRGAAEREARHRRETAREMLRTLPRSHLVQPIRILPSAAPGYLRLPVRAAHGVNGFRAPAQARKLGVSASYPAPLSAVPAVRDRLVGPERRWRGAEQLVRELITLPSHSRISAAERNTLGVLLDGYLN